MPLQSSGAISLNEMHIEAGGSSGTLCTINDSDIRGLISKGSGATMSFNEWYGASAAGLYNSSSINYVGSHYQTTGGVTTQTLSAGATGSWNAYNSSNFLSPLAGWDRYIAIIWTAYNVNNVSAHASGATYDGNSMNGYTYSGNSGGAYCSAGAFYIVDNSSTTLRNTVISFTSSYTTGGCVASLYMFYAKGTASFSLAGANTTGTAAISRNRTTTAPSIIFGAYSTYNSATGTWASPMTSIINNLDLAAGERHHHAYTVVNTSASTTTTPQMTASLYSSFSFRVTVAGALSFS